MIEADNEVDYRAQQEAEAEAEGQARDEAEAESRAHAEAEAEADAQRDRDSEAQADAEVLVAEAAEQAYNKEMAALRELRKALNNVNGIEVPANIIIESIHPLIKWLDYKLDEKLNDGGS